MVASIKILENFEALHKEIRLQDLDLTASPSDDVFCTLAWFENLAANGLPLSQGGGSFCRLLLARDFDTGRVVCLPLLGGKNLTSLSNYYSSLYGPLNLWKTGATAKTSEALPGLWKAVAMHLRQASTRWPTITLSPLDPKAPFFLQMLEGLNKAGYWADSYFCFGNWYLDVANRPFSAYFAGLPSPLRHNIERGQRRLDSHGPWSIHVQKVANSQLDASIADFVNVYSQSWKEPEPHPKFIPGLIRAAAAQGWLRLGVLRLGDRAIAAQLWLVKDRKASIYKLAYIKGFERFSAGSVLTSALMQHVIDLDGVQEVDYLTGDDAYKRDWMSHRRERRGIVAFHLGTAKGVWRAGLHIAGKNFRRL